MYYYTLALQYNIPCDSVQARRSTFRSSPTPTRYNICIKWKRIKLIVTLQAMYPWKLAGICYQKL